MLPPVLPAVEESCYRDLASRFEDLATAQQGCGQGRSPGGRWSPAGGAEARGYAGELGHSTLLSAVGAPLSPATTEPTAAGSVAVGPGSRTPSRGSDSAVAHRLQHEPSWTGCGQRFGTAGVASLAFSATVVPL